MYLSVKEVQPLSDYLLVVKIWKFQELKDENLFKNVKVCFDSIEWDNQLDLDPKLLYQKSQKKEHTSQ